VTVQNATPYAIYVHPLKQHCQVKPFLTIRGGTTSVYSRADLGNPDELRIHTYFGVYSAGQAVMAHPIVLVKPVSHRHDDGHWVADACTVVTREQAE